MAQVSLSNVSLSFLKNQLNIAQSISFSQLYNYSTDIPKISTISISELIGKYRTFIPTDITNLINWYDANTLHYIDYLTNNQAIFQWNDISGGNSNYAIQSNSLYQPYYYNSGLNGKPSVLFNSIYNTYSYLNLNSQYQTNAITIAVVFNTSGIKSNYIFSCQDIIIKHISKSPTINVKTNTNYLNTISDFKYLDNVPNIYIASIYIDTDGYTKSQLNYNGISNNLFTHDNSLTTLNISNIYIGGSPVSANNTLYGNISELIIYDKRLDTYNIQLLEGYLSAKWWGVPSYILPQNHLYYNISVLEPTKSPQLIYNFDASTTTSNILLLNNYGLKSYNLNGIIDNTDYAVRSSYYNGYNNHLNDLSIWYKFDSTNNLIYVNNGFSGSTYNLIISNGNNSYTSDYIRGDGSLRLSNTDIATTNTTANLINFGTYSSEYTIAFWYKVTAFINSSDTLFSLSGAPNNGSKFFIQRDGSTNNIIIGLPFNTSTISVPNAIYHDDIWRHIAVCLKKIGSNKLLLNIYLNGIIIINNLLLSNSWFSNNYTNYIVLNQYSTGSGIYSIYGANMLYDDFRLYIKSLSEFQVQSIMGYPISRQYGNKNSYGYLWNSYNTSLLDVNNNLQIDYVSFINTYFITNTYLTISYDLQVLPDISYNNNYEINIIHCNNNNINKLKIIHRFFTNSTNYIKIIINDITTISTTLYFPNIYNDNLTHNYIFKIPISLSGQNTILFYNDGVVNNSISINDSSVNEPDINQRFIKIGTYNNSLINLNVAPFILEDFKIYNRQLTDSELYYINSNYNIIPSYLYYNCNIYPFTNLLLNNCYSSSNAYGPVYNDIINNYSSNGLWIYNNNNINVYNGIQELTIPESGYYSIISAGACGGKSYTTSNVGKGIILKNYCYFNIYDKLYILVGQKGGDGTYSLRPNEYNLHGQGGGGGASYIIKYNNSNNINIILIAGGGGGSGEYILNGENSIGSDAVYTTSGNLDSANTGVISTNGNGGNIGLYGVSKGSGIGGGGYYTDGPNKFSIYGGVYSGICFLNILNGSNIGRPYYQNYGGIGGFGGGATGGTNYSLDLVWGGGGGGGYSGGVGGGAGSYQGQTHGGGGGGSYDINNINNNGTIIKSEGINGYNNDNGYVKIQFLTPYKFLDYANISKKISREGLTFLIEPFNNICYNNNDTPSSIINLVNGTYASFNGYYYYNIVNKSIHLDNFSIYNDANNTFLHVNTNDNIKSISIWYMVLTNPINNSCFIDTFNDFGHIYNNNIGADWNDGINDVKEGGMMYMNSSNVSTIINWSNLIYPLNVWKNITLISNSNLSNEIAFFNNDTQNGGINVEFGSIMVYNRIITGQEHLLNYSAYANIYNTSFKFFYTGSYQYYTVPPNIYKIYVKCYGAGGGCGGYNYLSGSANGGAGIFISCIINVNPNDILRIIVPSGGDFGKENTRSIGGYPFGGDGGYHSGAGGGFCAIMKNTEYLLIGAGGSGGGYFSGIYNTINTPLYTNNYTRGANAGFLTGDSSGGLESGNPGTQTTGGIAYQIKDNNFNIAQDGLKYIGSSGGVNYGGGSGQGYYGGSGGGEKYYFICGGAGSSSYVGSNCTNVYYEIGDNLGNAPGQNDIDYPNQGIGFGASTNSGNNGGNGYCVIKNII